MARRVGTPVLLPQTDSAEEARIDSLLDVLEAHGAQVERGEALAGAFTHDGALDDPLYSECSWCMIRVEGGPPERVRVTGALRAPMLGPLVDVVRRGAVVLELSELREADAAVVDWLAGLAGQGCRLVGCPKWLDVWINWRRLALGCRVRAAA